MDYSHNSNIIESRRTKAFAKFHDITLHILKLIITERKNMLLKKKAFYIITDVEGKNCSLPI